jgi:hypothetical protein
MAEVDRLEDCPLVMGMPCTCVFVLLGIPGYLSYI